MCIRDRSSTNVAKNIASGLIGILTAMVGTDPIDAMPRFHFGITDLTGGFNDVAVMLSLIHIFGHSASLRALITDKHRVPFLHSVVQNLSLIHI